VRVVRRGGCAGGEQVRRVQGGMVLQCRVSEEGVEGAQGALPREALGAVGGGEGARVWGVREGGSAVGVLGVRVGELLRRGVPGEGVEGAQEGVPCVIVVGRGVGVGCVGCSVSLMM